MANTKKLDPKARRQAKRSLRRAFHALEAKLTRKERVEWRKSEKGLKVYLAEAAAKQSAVATAPQ